MRAFSPIRSFPEQPGSNSPVSVSALTARQRPQGLARAGAHGQPGWASGFLGPLCKTGEWTVDGPVGRPVWAEVGSPDATLVPPWGQGQNPPRLCLPGLHALPDDPSPSSCPCRAHREQQGHRSVTAPTSGAPAALATGRGACGSQTRGAFQIPAREPFLL